jgi:glycosyltransferase involved in cell wall biosynthesis
VVFGQSQPADPPRLGLPLHYEGSLHDDQSLALLYSASDVMVVPSRMDNLPQTATGLPDVVEQQRTGYLASAFDPADLAAGIGWLLKDSERRECISRQARGRADELWNPHRIAPLYAALYEKVLAAAPSTMD